MSLPAPLRRGARRILPSVAADRSRQYESRFRTELGITVAATTFFDRYGDTVRSGPFAGMILGSGFVKQDCPVLKLLGLYEVQLHQPLEEALSRPLDRIVNLGCADGYYAVGLAMRAPRAVVVAYDLARSARTQTMFLAEQNDVSDRVVTQKRCRHFSVQPDVLLCDIEGGEFHFFKEVIIHELRNTFVVIEVHGDPEELMSRFSSSHELEVLTRALAEVDDDVFLEFDEPKRALLLDELRGSEQFWLVARPRT
jgi:hypothetical protein